MKRQTGILCPIASLNGEFGIGQLGKPAFEFIDFLAESGYTHWQILPINPVGAGNSPYSSASAFAGYFAHIDPLKLVASGLATSLQLPSIFHNENKIHYPSVEESMDKFLHLVFNDFFKKAEREVLASYELFVSKNSNWLNDYSLYSALKTKFDQKPWYEWPLEYKVYKEVNTASLDDSIGENMAFHKFVQFIFSMQWNELKEYAKEKNVKIIGDMPIYVSHDSADVWSQTELFDLNEDLSLKTVAGVPPDFFAQDGQLWGFPIYNWSQHEATNFKWWKSRWEHLRGMFDLVRFDHFRAIEAYWSVPATHHTARNGQWIKAPGKALLETIYPLGSQGMIAENLGDISSEVEELRKAYKIPGMKILQFAFGGNILSEHLPHYADVDDIYYTGTHDNDILKSWLEHASSEQRNHIKDYYGASHEVMSSLWLIDRALASGARLVILPIQDVMNLDNKSRTNTPGTVSDDNWSWRFTRELLSQIDRGAIAYKLRYFGRNI